MKNNKNFIHGNFEDKYGSKNLITKFLMKNFIKKFESNLLGLNKIKTICEVGTGEGELLKILHKKFPKARLFGCDLSKQEIAKVRNNCKNIKIELSVQDAQDLNKYKDNQFDLVVCCEVLEHLQNPEKGLQELLRISNKYLLISVPNEPIWRILNLARGKYLSRLGNTPGHLNFWNVFSFNKLMNKADLEILKSNYPFPWQMKLLKKRGKI